jgi:glycosyltransferase involved in cell wall biosynthesis
MESPARILYLDYTNNIGVGGGQRSLALLIRNLDRHPYQPVLSCPPDEGLLDLVDRNVEFAPLRLPDRFRSLSRLEAGTFRLAAAAAGAWSTVVLLARIIRDRRIALVHANNLKMLLLAAAAAPQIPRIWHVRDIFPATPAVRRAIGAAARLSTRVLAVSGAAAEQLPRCADPIVVHNAVELPAPVEARSDPGRPPTIGFVGRLDRLKGLSTLLEAYQMVRRQHLSARLLVAGDGPEEKIISASGVIRLGFQKDMTPVWRQMDIAVVPSIEPDAFPRSVIEAMSWGKPVVASATGGIPEAVEDGRTGYLVPPGDAGALAGHICALLASRSRMDQMGQAARLRCEQRFSAGDQAARIAAIYGGVLNIPLFRAA